MLRGFGGNTRGSAAIEFALLVGPFLLIVLASIEMGIKAFIQADLDRLLVDVTSEMSLSLAAADEAADYIETSICPKAGPLLDCRQVDLGATVVAGRLFDYRNRSLSGEWNLGCAGDTLLIEITYSYFDILFPFAVADIVRVDGEKRYRSRSVLRREPILAGGSACG